MTSRSLSRTSGTSGARKARTVSAWVNSFSASGSGVEPVPEMISHPRENPYVFYEEYFEEGEEEEEETEEAEA